MGAMASEVTRIIIVYSTVYLEDERTYQIPRLNGQ